MNAIDPSLLQVSSALCNERIIELGSRFHVKILDSAELLVDVIEDISADRDVKLATEFDTLVEEEHARIARVFICAGGSEAHLRNAVVPLIHHHGKRVDSSDKRPLQLRMKGRFEGSVRWSSDPSIQWDDEPPTEPAK